MPTHLEFKDLKSHKFWTISIKGKAHTVQFGKVGTTGQSKVKEFDSPAEAKADSEKLIRSKEKKGYKKVRASAAKKSAASKKAKPASKKAATKTTAKKPKAKPNTYGFTSAKLKHKIPQLLGRFAKWVGKQEHGSIGWFDTMHFETIYKEWDPVLVPKLCGDGFVFTDIGRRGDARPSYRRQRNSHRPPGFRRRRRTLSGKP